MTSQRVERLRALLFGCSIERPEAASTVGERALLDASRVVERCTPDELLHEMAADFDIVKAVVFGVSSRWEQLPGRLRTMRERLERLGDPLPGELDGELRELSRLLMVDPLAIDDDRVAAIEQALAETEAVHDDAVGLVAATRAVVATLPDAVDRAIEARRSAAERFAEHHLPAVVEFDASLFDRVEVLEGIAAAGAWRELPAELAAIGAIIDELVRRADQLMACAAVLLAERNELRGRLDALEAKAGALDRIEDPALSTLAARARSELYTAPTDLDVARTIVQDYLDALRQDVR